MNISPWKRKLYKRDKNGKYILDQNGKKVVSGFQWCLNYETYVQTPLGKKKVRKNISIANIDGTLPNTKSGALQAIQVFKAPGLIKSNNNIHFSEFTNELLPDIKSCNRESTYTSYVLTIKTFLELMPDKPLKMIDYDTMKDFRTKRSESLNKSIKNKDKIRKVSATTVNIDLRNLHHIFEEAIKSGYITENPCVGLDFRKTNKHKPVKKSFKKHQLKIILPAMDKNPIFKNMALYSLYTGTRLNEMLHTEWSDFEFQDEMSIVDLVNIKRSSPDTFEEFINDIKGYVNIINKEDFSIKTYEERRIPLSPEAILLLVKLKEEEGNIFDINNPLKTIWGKLYSDSGVSHFTTKILRSLGLPKSLTFHSFRHTTITDWCTAGVPLPQVQLWAGHADIQTTMGYVHMDDADSLHRIKSVSYSSL